MLKTSVLRHIYNIWNSKNSTNQLFCTEHSKFECTKFNTMDIECPHENCQALAAGIFAVDTSREYNISNPIFRKRKWRLDHAVSLYGNSMKMYSI